MKTFILSFLLITCVVIPAKAGDRELWQVFVNMTPDGSGPEAKACAEKFRQGYKSKDAYVAPKSLGETRARKIAGHETKVPLDFMTWKRGDLEKIIDHTEMSDGPIFFDCRPKEKIFSVAMLTAGGTLVHIKLNKKVSPKIATAMGLYVQLLGWTGFSP